MGAGYHGGFGNTYGAAAGDAVFKSSPFKYFENIANRRDKDYNGVYDIVAHGSSEIIQIMHNGESIIIDSRMAAKIILNKPDYKKGQTLRLLSCRTGSTDSGFAQNLSNKLNVIVEAPTKLVWAYPDGSFIVAPRRKDNPQMPDLTDRGYFKKFYPGGKKK